MSTRRSVTIRTLVAIGLMSALFVGCSEQASDQAQPKPEVAVAPYPLKVCVVSGEELGSMGEPVTIEHAGTQVKFCCDSCVSEFEKDPEKYLAMIAKASKGEAVGQEHPGHDHSHDHAAHE